MGDGKAARWGRGNILKGGPLRDCQGEGGWLSLKTGGEKGKWDVFEKEGRWFLPTGGRRRAVRRGTSCLAKGTPQVGIRKREREAKEGIREVLILR